VVQRREMRPGTSAARAQPPWHGPWEGRLLGSLSSSSVKTAAQHNGIERKLGQQRPGALLGLVARSAANTGLLP